MRLIKETTITIFVPRKELDAFFSQIEQELPGLEKKVSRPAGNVHRVILIFTTFDIEADIIRGISRAFVATSGFDELSYETKEKIIWRKD